MGNPYFEAQLAADTTLFKGEFGKSVTYVPADGSASSVITVVFDVLGQRNNSNNPTQDREFDAAQAERIEVWIDKADVTTVVQDEINDATGTNWVVDQVDEVGAWYQAFVTRKQGFIR